MEEAYALPRQLSPRRHESAVPGVAARVVADFCMATIALGVAYFLRFYAFPIPIPGGQLPNSDRYVQDAPLLAGCTVLVFALTGSYSNERGVIFVDELFGTLKALGASAVFVLAALSLFPPDRLSYSRLTFVLWACVAGLMIGCARFAIRKVERRQRARGIGARRSIVVGNGRAAHQLVQRIKMFPDYGYQLIGVLSSEPTSDQFQVVGPIANMAEVIDRNEIDVVFVALPQVDLAGMLDLIASNRRREVEFRVVPSALEVIASQVEPDQLAGIPLLRIRGGLGLAPAESAMKRLLDVALALVSLVVLAPLFGTLAVLIRTTSRGPVLLRQERVGLSGRPFEMLKFRSMRVNAEAQTGPVWTGARDRRRTILGRFLRRFSLDELPQLWNVLKGDMSLVGPRPERPVFVSDFNERIPAYSDRHSVRPGVTGWAQVNDLRGMTSVEERLIYDLYYIERWNLTFDLKIVLTTAFRVFVSKNAY